MPRALPVVGTKQKLVVRIGCHAQVEQEFSVSFRYQRGEDGGSLGGETPEQVNVAAQQTYEFADSLLS